MTPPANSLKSFRSGINSLFMGTSPSNIPRLVVTLVIYTIQLPVCPTSRGLTLGAFPDIPNKGPEILSPFGVNRNPAASIVCVPLMGWTSTTTLDVVIDKVERVGTLPSSPVRIILAVRITGVHSLRHNPPTRYPCTSKVAYSKGLHTPPTTCSPSEYRRRNWGTYRHSHLDS